MAQQYRFTVSARAQENMDAAVSDGNNVIGFMASEGYILVSPSRRYRAEAERQIAAAGFRTRKDSVRVVEAIPPEIVKAYQNRNKALRDREPTL